MPSKKKKYNARFPAGRIKKIMQTDEEVGKVAQAVPVIISRTLELFVESLLTKSMQITQARNAKTLTPSHMKQCILSENRFDFLKDLVKNVPDPSTQEDNENNANEAIDYSLNKRVEESAEAAEDVSKKQEIMANFYTEQGTSVARIPVIQYSPKLSHPNQPKLSFSIDNLVGKDSPPTCPGEAPMQGPSGHNTTNKPVQNVPATSGQSATASSSGHNNVPPLIPISHHNLYGHSSGDNNLYIDEDYDN